MAAQAELVLIFGGYGLLCGFVLGIAITGWVKGRHLARTYRRGYEHGRVEGVSLAARTVVPAKVVHIQRVRRTDDHAA